MKQNQVALVTGCSSGLGKMAALLLAEKKWDIVCNSRHLDDRLEQVIEEIQNLGGQAIPIPADVSHPDEAKRLVEETIHRWGRIDVLIHAVGPFIRQRKWFVDHSLEELQQMVQGNLLSAMWMCHQVIPQMRKQKSGRVILFGFGRIGEAPAWPDRSAYAAAKTGLASLTKTLAVEEAPFGISVNMVCPGDIVGEHKEMRIQDVIHVKDEETPRGRPGSGEDIARVIQFLCQEDSDFVTGNLIHVTGGLDVIHPVSKVKA
ncbi:SDR family oxidoreductase [Hazenella coriacea]|uniref:3-oxoacyl-[acyl-carrier protein] reductase n=1 Tax=Hazenella coriacea TaxID=1179467 RepID=A0A4V2UVS6_9BACL|nr:SDR family oxidoreductase [Hazenella coriacea]TCS96917.1 3-oxoacyl-[acyl-carrier protein] reductase [Hazenella coriacea]